ncbi:uncharacterized protein C1orf232 homolog isoform X1 [Pelobates fuscus]|uniref:uncharacterized protein C1orf232 homolog isoform X1 n=2 Tax=Pelobates fuscus TaxID=191477 RepID=UPI002FE48A5A
MSQAFWKVYKSKVLQTFNAEEDGEIQEESDTAEMIEPEKQDMGEEGLNMSQLAKKVQGALGWRSITSLFGKEEEEHRTDHGADTRPEEEEEQPSSPNLQETPQERNPSALWSVFSRRWQQSSTERTQSRGVLAEPPVDSNVAQHTEETPFRWGFLTSKIAELRSKSD